MMIELIDGCIVQSQNNTDRQVSLVFPETTIAVCDQDMLVWWKQGFHWKNSKEIGDGMAVPLIHNRPFVIYELHAELFVCGLSLYQEYDEQTDLHNIYLYRYPKGENYLRQLTDLLDAYTDDTTIHQGRFTQIETSILCTPESVHKFLHKLRVRGALSFLFGLATGYGVVRGDADIMHNVMIQLPLLGTVGQFRESIDYACRLLIDHGMYMQLQETQSGEYNMLQIYIDDWEVLYHMMTWYNMPTVSFASVSKLQTHTQYKEQLQDFLAHSGSRALSETVGYSVLKMLTK